MNEYRIVYRYPFNYWTRTTDPDPLYRRIKCAGVREHIEYVWADSDGEAWGCAPEDDKGATIVTLEEI